jgi:hypothetical protein
MFDSLVIGNRWAADLSGDSGGGDCSITTQIVTELVAEEQRVNPWFVGSPARREAMGAHGTE